MKTQLLLVLCLVILTGCQRATANKTQVSQTPGPPVVSETPHQSAHLPTEAELRAVIRKNYEDVVTIDESRPAPFMIGDFNGDNSEDIAIVVKPRRLSDLNSEYVNWILEDPRQTGKIRPTIKRDDLLLAVIHGVDRQGWRNETARQTYLLQNAVGNEFATQPGRELKKMLPRLQGDVIREKLDGTAGIIFWTGGRYAWHPIT